MKLYHLFNFKQHFDEAGLSSSCTGTDQQAANEEGFVELIRQLIIDRVVVADLNDLVLLGEVLAVGRNQFRVDEPELNKANVLADNKLIGIDSKEVGCISYLLRGVDLLFPRHVYFQIVLDLSFEG